MAHPYRIRDVAQQAGLSTATVDRVLNGRPGVRASTVAEVHRAIADLDRQASQVSLLGRTFLVTVVMLAPRRFTDAVRAALEAELPALRPAVLRARFHLREDGAPADMARALDQMARRGASMLVAVTAALERHPDVDTVHPIGGGNRAILAAFDRVGRRPRAFIAHDLDADNVALLRQRLLTAVLHHDLRADLRQACRAVLQAQGAVPGRPSTRPSRIQVITPHNEPAGLVQAVP